MRIYWRLKSVPELAVLPRSERQDAFVQAVQRRRSRFSTGQRAGEFVGIAAAGGIAAVVATLLISNAVWGAALGGALGAAVGNHVRLAQAAAELRSQQAG
jgi:hypothetical protein